MFALLLPLVTLAAAAVLGLGWDASGRAIHPDPGVSTWQLTDYPELEGEDTVVESPTGAKLVGRLFPGRTKATIVLLHGYGGSQDEMLPVASALHAAGFSVFTYDQRSSGRSTGEATFGAREQEDLVAVVDYLSSLPEVDADRLGAFGFSMGGATLILTAAHEPRIKAVVADSAWSDVRSWLRPSARDAFVHPRNRFNALSLKLAELRTGIDLDELRPADVISRISPRRVLLLHGAADEVVRPSDGERNFEAALEPKELVLVADAAHGDTIAPGGASTSERVAEFFDAAFEASKPAA